MQAQGPVARDGEHAQRVTLVQVLFGAWKLGQIAQVVQIVGMNAGGIEGLSIEVHVFLCVT
jgi:hypothetical protein